ncbi:TPA: helix-turn-helix domain-containing protein [Photobacterium damselae]|uniref:helix-turn-helix domain-containing protein n=1 Tax=Photobacterium damselae TaxID=38293 RepID=UPI0040685C1D
MFNSPIPERLKVARKRKGISQKTLGVRVGMDESSASPRMNQYEKGRHTPDIQTLRLIAKELDVPLNYFFCEDEISAKLACLIYKISDEEKKKLVSLLIELQEK